MAKFVPNFFPFGEAGDEVSFYFCSRNVCFFDGLFFFVLQSRLYTVLLIVLCQNVSIRCISNPRKILK